MIYSTLSLWDKLKRNSRRLELSDQYPEQTHLHHTFVTVLLGGLIALSMITVVQLALGSFGFRIHLDAHEKLAIGCFVANLCYLIRELEARWGNWTYALWDGILDVYVPACFWVPAYTGSLTALFWMLLAYAALFFAARPLR